MVCGGTGSSDIIIKYYKTRIFRVPFISRILRPWWIRENNGPRIYILAAVC